MAENELNRSTAGDQNESDDTLVILLRPSRNKAPQPSLIHVCRIWTERGFNGKALMQTMSLLWAVKRGLQVSELEKNLFMFRFGDARDKTKVLMGEPWHFDRNVLILQSIEGNEQPFTIDLFRTPFWVHVYDLPFNYRDPEVARMIGKKLGFLMDVYEEDEWEMLSFLRVRVMLNLRVPLCKHLEIKIEEGVTFTVLFKYENLPSFCFFYGRLGHSMKDCGYDSNEENGGSTQINFGEELQAPPFRKAASISKAPWTRGLNRSANSPQSSHQTRPPTHPSINPQYDEIGATTWRTWILRWRQHAKKYKRRRLRRLRSSSADDNESHQLELWRSRECSHNSCALCASAQIYSPDCVGQGNERSEGLALFWVEEVILILKSFSFHHIDVLVDNWRTQSPWRLSGIYGWPKQQNKNLTWALMRQLSHQSTDPGSYVGI
ncbi:hypothetical protein Tsubulata_040286 [Turnera subulata]|uniref:DUF4283 domain-containing protein n=1 Tax=Turnera subulata TaxID=218843 RepID=A0A9Q0G3S4_9ROSI|nr:hypothetical protein Tsubulata_040286 [Turnera subulata]